MAITRQSLSDFVVYTTFMDHEDIHIDNTLTQHSGKDNRKLLDFYFYAMVPELLTGLVKRGIPMYPKIFSYK